MKSKRPFPEPSLRLTGLLSPNSGSSKPLQSTYSLHDNHHLAWITRATTVWSLLQPMMIHRQHAPSISAVHDSPLDLPQQHSFLPSSTSSDVSSLRHPSTQPASSHVGPQVFSSLFYGTGTDQALCTPGNHPLLSYISSSSFPPRISTLVIFRVTHST